MTVRPIEQTHLRVDPGFGQHYFYQIDRQDIILTSPNTPYLPAPPPPNEKNGRKNLLLHWRYPRYIPDDMPHLAFIHKHPIYHGPIFERLNVRYSNVPIDKTEDGKFILRDTVIASWHRLETALFGIQKLLITYPATNSFGDLQTGDLPFECGYQRPHKTEHIARLCAIMSRDAFALLGALCSFAISFYRTRPLANQIVPPWHKVLMRHSYGHEWLELLEGTFICDFSRGARVGGFIRANTTGLFPQIRAYLDSNVPVWVEWVMPQMEVSNEKYGKPFKPKSDQIKRAFELAVMNDHGPVYGLGPGDEWEAPDQPSFYQGGSVPYDDGWHVEPGEQGKQSEHRMIPGLVADPDDESDYGPPGLGDEDEDIDNSLDFISSQAASQIRPSFPAPCPSPPAPRRILQAPRPSLPTTTMTNMPPVHAGSGQSIGQTHTEFFKRREAEKVCAMKKESWRERRLREDLEGKADKGYKVRVKAVFLWKLEGGSWVRTIVDQFNISTVWAQYPQHLRVYSHFHQEWDICPFIETPDDSRYSRDSLPRGSPPEGGVSDAENLVASYDTTNTALSKRLYTRGLTRLLALRYGFTVPPNYVANPPNVNQPSQVLKRGQNHQAKFRLHGRRTDDFGNDEAVREMWNAVFLSEVAVGLPCRFDMSPQASSSVSLSHEKLRLGIASAVGNANTNICLIGVKDEQFSKQWYLLAFKDFATVVQIFREGWTKGIMDAGRQLLGRGIPFNTVVFRDKQPVAVERDCLGLGYRPNGYVPRLQDYAHYEYQRSKLLREHDGLYARVALKMGGLYWRLAMEDADDCETLVKDTMKWRPFSRPVGQVVGRVSSTQFLIDDQLSPAAAAVLSGVYAVETSISNQVEHISWWPKQDTWYQSELNVGYWSEACEDWYQQRLTEIRGENPEMMNGAAWRTKIKGRGPHVAMFKTKFSLFAEDFVEGNANLVPVS